MDDLEKIDWDSSAFDSIVIPPNHTEIVQSLVERYTNELDDERFDDVIQGKGQNVVSFCSTVPNQRYVSTTG